MTRKGGDGYCRNRVQSREGFSTRQIYQQILNRISLWPATTSDLSSAPSLIFSISRALKTDRAPMAYASPEAPLSSSLGQRQSCRPAQPVSFHRSPLDSPLVSRQFIVTPFCMLLSSLVPFYLTIPYVTHRNQWRPLRRPMSADAPALTADDYRTTSAAHSTCYPTVSSER